MPIVHFDCRRSARAADAQRVSGRGFTLYQRSPGDPDRVLHIQEWTDEVDALYASDGPARVALRGEHAGDVLRHLARYAGSVRSLSIESESRLDGAPLEAFTSLARLALTCAMDDVPFGKLVALRVCEINSPMTLDALGEAPWLEDLLKAAPDLYAKLVDYIDRERADIQ